MHMFDDLHDCVSQLCRIRVGFISHFWRVALPRHRGQTETWVNKYSLSLSLSLSRSLSLSLFLSFFLSLSLSLSLPLSFALSLSPLSVVGNIRNRWDFCWDLKAERVQVVLQPFRGRGVQTRINWSTLVSLLSDEAMLDIHLPSPMLPCCSRHAEINRNYLENRLAGKATITSRVMSRKIWRYSDWQTTQRPQVDLCLGRCEGILIGGQRNDHK